MVTEGQHWRINVARKIRKQNTRQDIPGFSTQEINEMLTLMTTAGSSRDF